MRVLVAALLFLLSGIPALAAERVTLKITVVNGTDLKFEDMHKGTLHSGGGVTFDSEPPSTIDPRKFGQFTVSGESTQKISLSISYSVTSRGRSIGTVTFSAIRPPGGHPTLGCNRSELLRKYYYQCDGHFESDTAFGFILKSP